MPICPNVPFGSYSSMAVSRQEPVHSVPAPPTASVFIAPQSAFHLDPAIQPLRQPLGYEACTTNVSPLLPMPHSVASLDRVNFTAIERNDTDTIVYSALPTHSALADLKMSTNMVCRSAGWNVEPTFTGTSQPVMNIPMGLFCCPSTTGLSSGQLANPDGLPVLLPGGSFPGVRLQFRPVIRFALQLRQLILMHSLSTGLIRGRTAIRESETGGGLASKPASCVATGKASCDFGGIGFSACGHSGCYVQLSQLGDLFQAYFGLPLDSEAYGYPSVRLLLQAVDYCVVLRGRGSRCSLHLSHDFLDKLTRRVAYSTSFITRDSNRLASGLLESQNGPCSATHSSTQPQRQLTRSVLANQEIRESTAGQATDPTSILHPVQLHDNLHMAYQARAYPIPQQSFQCQQQHQQHQFEQQTQSYTTAGNIRLVYPVSTPNTIALFQPIETNLSGGHLVSTAKNDLFYNQQQMNASFSGEPVTTNLPGPLGLPPLHLMPTVGVVPSYPSTFYSFPIYPSSLLQVQPNQQALLPRPPVFLYQQARQRPQLPQAPTAPLLPPPPPPPQPPAQQPIILQAPVKMPGPAPAPLLHVPQPFQAQSRGDPRSVVLSTQPFRPQIRLLQPRYLNDLGAQYGSSDGNCGGVGNTLTSPGQFVYAQNRVHFQMGRKTRLRKTHSSSTHALPAQRANLLPSSLLKQCQSHTEQFSQYPLQSAGSMMITPTLQPIPGRLEPGSSSPETLSTQSASTDQWFHQFQCPKFAPGLSGGQNCQLLSLSPLEQMNNTFGCFLQMPNSEGSEYLYNLVPSQQNRLSESDGYALSGHIEPTTTIPPIPNDPSREASLFCCQNIANHHAMIRSAGAPCNYNLIGPTSAVLPSAHSITSGAASLETNLSSEVSRAADSFQSASDKYFNSFSLPAHEIQLPEALPVFCPASASYESGCMDKTALILPFPPDVGIRPDCAAPGKAFTTSNYWSALSSSTVVPCPLTYPWPSSVNSLTYNDCKNLFPLDEVKPACETNLLANHKSEEEFKAFQETLRQSTCQGAAKGFDQLMADHFAVTTVASAVCDENLELFSDQFAEPQSNRELDTSNGVSSPFSGCPIGARPAELGLSPAARSVSLSCSSGADSLSSHINSLEDIMAQLAVNTKAFSPLETVR